MSDLFDLPFEEEDEDGHQSPVTGPQSLLRPDTEGKLTTGDQAPPIRGRGLPTGDQGLPTGRVISVTELTVRIRDLLESEFQEVWIEGELSNCRAWNTGHLYFTLKDASSQIRAVIFRTALRYLKFKPAA